MLLLENTTFSAAIICWVLFVVCCFVLSPLWGVRVNQNVPHLQVPAATVTAVAIVCFIAAIVTTCCACGCCEEPETENFDHIA